jgi:methylated-DNA-protein-cysteine methyltransferase related protein
VRVRGAARSDGLYARIYSVVRRIPRGRVATYGQVAELADLPRQPRLVGYALHALDEDAAVPWQRVINARGEVSLRSEPGFEGLQESLLEAEGVRFDERGRVDLARYRWKPRNRPAPRAAGRP